MIDQKGQASVNTVKLPILDSLNSSSIAWSLNPLLVNNLTRVIETCLHILVKPGNLSIFVKYRGIYKAIGDFYRLIDIGYSVWDHAHLSNHEVYNFTSPE